jgi:tight adherence protein B
VLVGVAIVAATWLLQVPILFALVFGLAGGYLLPRMYLRFRRKRFQNAFLDELPNAVEAIVRGVKSGLPLNDSMRVVAKEVKEPLPEVNFFVVVITVQQQAGGNLSEALGNLSRVLRNRKKMKQKVKAMSSEAKASAGIVGSLPFIVSILVSLTTPGYMLPLVQTPIGMIWLGIAALLMGTGIFIMYKMVQFDF